jgi:hypothetical protein
MFAISPAPLGREDLLRLSKLLLKSWGRWDQNSLTISHGILTAIASAPHIILLEVWEQLIIGDDPCLSDKEYRQLMGLVLRLYQQVLKGLNGPKPFVPLFFEHKKTVLLKNASEESFSQWCFGYVLGARIDTLWRHDKEGKEGLVPFIVLVQKGPYGAVLLDSHIETNGKEGLALPPKAIEGKYLPQYIDTIFNYWLKKRQECKTLSLKDLLEYEKTR